MGLVSLLGNMVTEDGGRTVDEDDVQIITKAFDTALSREEKGLSTGGDQLTVEATSCLHRGFESKLGDLVNFLRSKYVESDSDEKRLQKLESELGGWIESHRSRIESLERDPETLNLDIVN